MTWVYFHYLFLLCFSAFHFFFPANFTSRAYPFPLVFLLYMMLDLFYFQYSYSDVREYYYCIRIRVARSTSAKNGKFTKKAKKSTSKNAYNGPFNFNLNFTEKKTDDLKLNCGYPGIGKYSEHQKNH